MISIKELEGILTADAVMEMLLYLACVAVMIFYIIAFKKYETTPKWLGIGKMIEAIATGVYTIWLLVFNIISSAMYPSYYHFTQTADLIIFIVYSAGSILCLIGLLAKKKHFFLAQSLICVYHFVRFITLISTFAGEYTTTYQRNSMMILYFWQSITCVLGSFLMFELFKRLKNDEEIGKSYPKAGEGAVYDTHASKSNTVNSSFVATANSSMYGSGLGIKDKESVTSRAPAEGSPMNSSQPATESVAFF
ncbi:uncharacterized protein MONOS_6565 [Monocercomonoides exilis]|uniref:uncharacterized protein n=1 Tax=Monocercomonoides exilis TaxID=2049356 RepID=UPI00355A4F53|nr:hypothetical protein MONOS_6565 [Monocercomonoides exilis]|eukprot:MONOS_6565.1-p1 / transcript=MONOS_6565.1 / gene=MONOS_6565 / organism=Monocercomonoides_exilis_PA203 / gene_product=unspecified product / transcript_product=unspecified product / location=Mono_scaffold00208:82769-83772(-) / protein_length=250 / sequence_SO=supercontig / SO=protein_coding / is_pseudo=false